MSNPTAAPQPPDGTNPNLPIRDQLSAAQHTAETLSALNWDTYTCQCAHGHTCTSRADYIVHIHAIDACNNPELGPFRNHVEIRCAHCVRRLQAGGSRETGPAQTLGQTTMHHLRRTSRSATRRHQIHQKVRRPTVKLSARQARDGTQNSLKARRSAQQMRETWESMDWDAAITRLKTMLSNIDTNQEAR